MDKIIVTGATSMIGVATIESAIAHGVEAYAIVRAGTRRLHRLPESDRVHVVYASLDGLSDIKGLPKGADAFYHFAWAGTDKDGRDDPVIQEKNIHYTLGAVELARKCGCGKFIFAGSQAEYGPTDGEIDDETRFNPVTAYGVAKLAAGKLSRKSCDKYGMTCIHARVFSVYGRYDNEGTMIDYAIDQFLKGEVAEFSAGTQMWDYLYEKDAGKMFYLMGVRIRESTEIIVASGHSKELKKYIVDLSRKFDAEGLCRFGGNEQNGRNGYGLQANVQRTIRMLGFSPKDNYTEMIDSVILAHGGAKTDR